MYGVGPQPQGMPPSPMPTTSSCTIIWAQAAASPRCYMGKRVPSAVCRLWPLPFQ